MGGRLAGWQGGGENDEQRTTDDLRLPATPPPRHPATPLLRVIDLHKNFGANEVLKGIDLDVNPGETITIIGPSGSGKTTLMRCINYLERPTSGHVYIGDR